jgi:hypothetical protein
MHSLATPHEWPQDAQCAGSLETFTSQPSLGSPLQSAYPAEHPRTTQPPAMQSKKVFGGDPN